MLRPSFGRFSFQLMVDDDMNPTDGSIPPVIPASHCEPLTPVGAEERIETLDALRGFALFGILTVNIVGYGWPMDQTMERAGLLLTRTDVIADWIVRFLAEGKFYPLFAFLFGVGAGIQFDRLAARGVESTGRFRRRLAVLLAIGLGHGLLIWEGDILVHYALCGFLLLPFRKRQPKTLLIWAAGCLLIPALLVALLWALLAALSLVPEFAGAMKEGLAQDPEAMSLQLEEAIRVMARGSAWEIFVERAGNTVIVWLSGLFFAPTVLGMFLLGLYAVKRRVFHDLEAGAGRLRRVLVVGLIIGLPLNLAYAAGMSVSDYSDPRLVWLLCTALVLVGGPVQSLACAAALALAMRSEWWRRCVRPVAAAGRMALTNYLGQSVICTLIFYSYGLGLFGSVGRADGLVLVGAIFAMQAAGSIWWLRKFQFGPAEWLWRSLTYGKRQPMRR